MKDKKTNLTSVSIEKETLDEIRKIANSKGMKIYGFINEMFEFYKMSLNVK